MSEPCARETDLIARSQALFAPTRRGISIMKLPKEARLFPGGKSGRKVSINWYASTSAEDRGGPRIATFNLDNAGPLKCARPSVFVSPLLQILGKLLI